MNQNVLRNSKKTFLPPLVVSSKGHLTPRQESILYRGLSEEYRRRSIAPSEAVAGIIKDKARTGKYINLSLLSTLDFSRNYRNGLYFFSEEKLIRSGEVTRQRFLWNIEAFREDAIAHLCVPEPEIFLLGCSHNIYALSELRSTYVRFLELIKENVKGHIPNLLVNTYKQLMEWEELPG